MNCRCLDKLSKSQKQNWAAKEIWKKKDIHVYSMSSHFENIQYSTIYRYGYVKKWKTNQ